jgi:HEAT repeat protein
MGSPDRLAALVGALHDEREGLRQFAVRQLVDMGPKVIPHLIVLLGDTKDYTQESTAIVLATFGRDAMPYLINAMKNHPERSVRWGAAWVLASMASEARKLVPPVAVQEEREQTAEVPQRQPAEMWADGWLTKVRENLAAARQRDVLNLGGA